MSDKIISIGFDADDTLWHCEDKFVEAHNELNKLFPGRSRSELTAAISEIELKNIELYGFGVKSFTLSLIETYLKLSITTHSDDIRQLIDIGKSMSLAPVFLLEGVERTLKLLSDKYYLILITKGELIDQERKISKSQLSKYFDIIEIVSKKNSETYLKILNRHAIAKQNFIMIGNSIRSDIQPVLNIGSRAIHIPYKYTWIYEDAVESPINEHYTLLGDISLVPSWLDKNT